MIECIKSWAGYNNLDICLLANIRFGDRLKAVTRHSHDKAVLSCRTLSSIDCKLSGRRLTLFLNILSCSWPGRTCRLKVREAGELCSICLVGIGCCVDDYPIVEIRTFISLEVRF